ncbi:MAG: hypothetical protein ACR2FL_01460 [Nocardioidaceae bacterium]
MRMLISVEIAPDDVPVAPPIASPPSVRRTFKPARIVATMRAQLRP